MTGLVPLGERDVPVCADGVCRIPDRAESDAASDAPAAETEPLEAPASA